MAALPATVIEKSLVSDRIIIDTVVSKYSDHLPLYRQSAILSRETGIVISRATMDGWVMRVGEMLLPLVERMRGSLVSGSYIQADETPVAVQVTNGSGSNHQAYLWQYGRPGGETVFDFRMGRGREGPKKFLAKFNGILQTDGYAAYDRVGGGKTVRAACWAHARRKFVEALKLSPKDAVAARLVAAMDALFAVEASARGLGLQERQALRREKSEPMLTNLREELKRQQRELLPASALGKAVSYTLTLWPKLVCFLDHAELELSNNLAENSMRGVALGRKNWIHVGSEAAGPKVAAILSVVESCRRLGVPARAYLAEVLPGLSQTKIQDLDGKTPTAWLASRARA
jgi:transposase